MRVDRLYRTLLLLAAAMVERLARIIRQAGSCGVDVRHGFRSLETKRWNSSAAMVMFLQIAMRSSLRQVR